MGDVYVARDGVLERDVAVKVLADRLAQEDEPRRRFTREALAAARLSSVPHVVTIYDVGEYHGRPFIVMELLAGGSLHERVRRGPVPPATALNWLEQAARALDAAHAQGVVHRDVKPGNLMLDREDVVHVSDFGIASAAGFDQLTSPGTILGTAGYLSPEQARGEPAGPASDRYGLGVVAFELLTGSRPFAADTPTAEAFAHANTAPPSASSANPRLPRELDDVFARALAKQPEHRYETCAELVVALRDAFRLAEAPTVVASAGATAGTPAPEPRRRRVTLLAPFAAAAVLLGLAGVGLALAIGGNDGGREVVTRVQVQTVEGEAQTVTQSVTETVTAPEAPADAQHAPDARTGEQLNNDGFALMRDGNYDEALPLLEQAVTNLQGSGDLAEAYASYNLAFTRLALGRCDGVLELLDRSQRVQGERKEIDRLRKQAERRCDGD
jgi:tetratricopeptide (TPR) repeat protein